MQCRQEVCWGCPSVRADCLHARSWRWRQVWLNLIGKSICYITAAETFYGEGSIGTRRMRTCVFTVMHAGNERYFGEFLTSLAKQSDLDFELLVINDAPSWQDRCCGAERMPELPFRWRWIDVAGCYSSRSENLAFRSCAAKSLPMPSSLSIPTIAWRPTVSRFPKRS